MLFRKLIYRQPPTYVLRDEDKEFRVMRARLAGITRLNKGSSEQFIHELSEPEKQKVRFLFSHKISRSKRLILAAHPCAAGKPE
jgi:hypothetical protein